MTADVIGAVPVLKTVNVMIEPALPLKTLPKLNDPGVNVGAALDPVPVSVNAYDAEFEVTVSVAVRVPVAVGVNRIVKFSEEPAVTGPAAGAEVMMKSPAFAPVTAAAIVVRSAFPVFWIVKDELVVVAASTVLANVYMPDPAVMFVDPCFMFTMGAAAEAPVPVAVNVNEGVETSSDVMVMVDVLYPAVATGVNATENVPDVPDVIVARALVTRNSGFDELMDAIFRAAVPVFFTVKVFDAAVLPSVTVPKSLVPLADCMLCIRSL
jgi:hypothetical protein